MALDNLVEKDIEDCPLEDRVFIQSIILELREYIQTLPDKFLQFNLFRDVINAQYQENPISGLMILRNKLWLYAQNNLFANDKEEFQSLNSAILENNCIVIDASEIDEKWQNFVIQFISESVSENCYFFINFDGLNISKKFINDFYNNNNLIPVVSSSYSNPCRSILSLISKNQILCKPSILFDENVQYIDYLHRLNLDEFIAFGEATLYLPLIISMQEFDSSTLQTVLEHDIKRDVDKLLTGGSSAPLANVETINVSNEVENNQINEIEQQEEVIEEVQVPQEQNLVDENILDDDLTQSDLDFLDEMLAEEEQQNHVEEIPESVQFEEIENTVEEVVETIDDVEQEIILEDESETPIQDVEEIEDVVDNVVDDVVDEVQEDIQQEVQEDIIDVVENDVVQIEEVDMSGIEEEIITEKTPEFLLDEEEFFNVQETEIQEELDTQEELVQEEYIQDETLVEEETSDLMIEDEEEQTEQDEYNEEQVEYADQTEQIEDVEEIEIDESIDEQENPNLVVYETDVQQKLNKEDLPFDVGDKVYHPKHGNGIVQGFTNYSDKILFCQIEFENVGRRILDPRVAQLEKV